MPGKEGTPSGQKRQSASPLHQKNWAATQLHHPMHPWPVAPTRELGWISSSPKRNRSNATSKASAIYCGLTIDLPAPNCHNSQHPKPPAVGHTTFTITGDPEVTIEEVVKGPLTKSEK